jgi:hypothetical protein
MCTGLFFSVLVSLGWGRGEDGMDWDGLGVIDR